MQLKSTAIAPYRIEIFWSRVDKSGGPNSCWPFTGGRCAQTGHGRFSDAPNNRALAHRVAYQICVGNIPDGAVVRHTCDMPCCCNPRHLVIGTIADNNRDMFERHGHPRHWNVSAAERLSRLPARKNHARFSGKRGVKRATSESHSERFWSKISRGPDSDCWEWTASKKPNGYGVFTNWMNGRRNMHAHKAAWILTHGTVPDGLCVLHRCNNRACCNPSHLYIGTRFDNARDRRNAGTSRGGSMPGEYNPAAKLTKIQVSEIRNLWVPWTVTKRQLALRFGVSWQCIDKIVRMATWKDQT